MSVTPETAAAPAPEISVVVPCYNEVGNVEPLIAEIRAALGSTGRTFEIIYVDDRGTDGTYELLCRLKPTIPELRVFRHKTNLGESAAILTGMENARGELVASMDADLQNDPADLPAMLALLEREGADMVAGVRGKRADTGIKRFTSKVANGVRGALLADGVSDAGCTMRLMRRRALTQLIAFRALHRFTTTLIKWHGFKVIEMKINHRARNSGSSKYGTLDRLFVGIVDMMGMAWYRARRLPPERSEPEV